MGFNRKIVFTALILYFLSQLLFLVLIQFPKGYSFDEFHYVPSAKQFLALQENRNWEHPPLGKLFMAAGIYLFGDRPIGWRYMSTVFGSLTLVGMYLLGFALFQSETTALWVALITLFNQLLYVQARIGMLDTFMMGFLAWAMASFCATWHASKRDLHALFAFTGLALGLATACKWVGAVLWVGYVLLFVAIRLFQKWEMVFKNPSPDDWYTPSLWKGVSWKHAVLYLGIIPLFAYFLTFIPYLFIKNSQTAVTDFFGNQIKMWEGQLRVISRHPYMSHWQDWPLMIRPIWYAFEREGTHNEFARGVLLVGNPLIMWTGLIAIGACFWDWIQTRNRNAFLIFFFYFLYNACWIFIPRKIEFYYYYYPAGMTLSLALAYIFHDLEDSIQWTKWVFLGAALGLFVYFFPILSGVKIVAESFRQWMWFSSWIK